MTIIRPDETTRPEEGDGGFTLVELMVSMAVFSILMMVMGAMTLSSFTTINSVSARSETQAQASLAMESVSRMIRYTSKPSSTDKAIETASRTAITFYTYSGTGLYGAAPYKVRLFTSTANGKTSVITRTWAPTTYQGTWSGWTSSTPLDRTLFTVPSTALTPLVISVTKCNTNEGYDCYGTRQAVTLTTTEAAFTLDPGWVPDTVTVSLGDQNQAKYVVKQQVSLVNSIGLVNAT